MHCACIIALECTGMKNSLLTGLNKILHLCDFLQNHLYNLQLRALLQKPSQNHPYIQHCTASTPSTATEDAFTCWCSQLGPNSIGRHWDQNSLNCNQILKPPLNYHDYLSISDFCFTNHQKAPITLWPNLRFDFSFITLPNLIIIIWCCRQLLLWLN